MKVRFIRFDKRAKIPKRAHYSDTGADIEMMEGGSLEPFETKVIPLGFGVEIPNGYSAEMQVRTSIAKRGIIIQQCAIDAGFVGELSMILHNLSTKTFSWNKGDRLGYIKVHASIYPEFVEKLPEGRGSGKFGSTGR